MARQLLPFLQEYQCLEPELLCKKSYYVGTTMLWGSQGHGEATKGTGYKVEEILNDSSLQLLSHPSTEASSGKTLEIGKQKHIISGLLCPNPWPTEFIKHNKMIVLVATFGDDLLIALVIKKVSYSTSKDAHSRMIILQLLLHSRQSSQRHPGARKLGLSIETFAWGWGWGWVLVLIPKTGRWFWHVLPSKIIHSSSTRANMEVFANCQEFGSDPKTEKESLFGSVLQGPFAPTHQT